MWKPRGTRFPSQSYKTRHCQSDKNRLFDSSGGGSRNVLIQFDVTGSLTLTKNTDGAIRLIFRMDHSIGPNAGEPGHF